MPSTKQLKNAASYVFGENKISNIEKLATDVEKFFLNNFDERFPEIQLTDTDKDALTHFYGQTLSQQQEGSVMADLINNMSAVLPDFGVKQQKKYGNIISGLIQDPESKVSNKLLQEIVDYGLDYTVDPPARQKY